MCQGGNAEAGQGVGPAFQSLAVGQWSAASAHFLLVWGPSHISSHSATGTALSRRLSWKRRPAGSWSPGRGGQPASVGDPSRVRVLESELGLSMKMPAPDTVFSAEVSTSVRAVVEALRLVFLCE